MNQNFLSNSKPEEGLLMENMIRDNLFTIHKDKSQEELLNLLIDKEVELLNSQKTIENLKNRIQGRKDFPLSDFGKEEAILTASYLKENDPKYLVLNAALNYYKIQSLSLKRYDIKLGISDDNKTQIITNKIIQIYRHEPPIEYLFLTFFT